MSQKLVHIHPITAHSAHFYGQLVNFLYFLCTYQRYTQQNSTDKTGESIKPMLLLTLLKMFFFIIYLILRLEK